MKSHAIVLVILSTLLSGCNTFKNWNAPERISLSEVPADYGIVIFSTGAPGKCVGQSTYLKLLPAKNSANKDNRLIPVDSYTVESDFTDHYGHLNAVPLHAGDYYLLPWMANPYVSPIKISKADFSVAAGEVVYVGEYFQPVSCALIGVQYVSDQEKRDMAMLKEKNPALAQKNIVKRILSFTVYKKE